MICQSEKKFDYSAFEKKLRHYFSDSAPCEVSYTLGLKTIRVSRETNLGVKEVVVPLDEDKSVSDMIHEIILSCEVSVYPTFIREECSQIDLSTEDKEKLIAKGFNPIEILMSKKERIVQHLLVLSRMSVDSNHFVLRDPKTNERFLYRLKYMPVLIFLERHVLNTSPQEAYERLVELSDCIKITEETNEEV